MGTPRRQRGQPGNYASYKIRSLRDFESDLGLSDLSLEKLEVSFSHCNHGGVHWSNSCRKDLLPDGALEQHITQKPTAPNLPGASETAVPVDAFVARRFKN